MARKKSKEEKRKELREKMGNGQGQQKNGAPDPIEELAKLCVEKLDVDPSEFGKAKERETEKNRLQEIAKELGPRLFETLFRGDVNVLEGWRLMSIAYHAQHNIWKDYAQNWGNLLTAMEDIVKQKNKTFINHSKDWDRVRKQLRACYRPHVVVAVIDQMVQDPEIKLDSGKANILKGNWDILVELQKERSKVSRLKEVIVEVCTNGASAETEKARELIQNKVAELQLAEIEQLEENRNTRQKARLKKLIERAEWRHEKVKKVQEGTTGLAEDMTEFAGKVNGNGKEQPSKSRYDGMSMSEMILKMVEENEELAEELSERLRTRSGE